MSMIGVFNRAVSNAVNKSNADYMAIFGDPSFVPEIEITESSDFNCGALCNELEYLRSTSKYYVRSFDIDVATDLNLDAVVNSFIDLPRRNRGEPDEIFRNRFRTIVNQSLNRRRTTRGAILDALRYFIPNAYDIVQVIEIFDLYPTYFQLRIAGITSFEDALFFNDPDTGYLDINFVGGEGVGEVISYVGELVDRIKAAGVDYDLLFVKQFDLNKAGYAIIGTVQKYVIAAAIVKVIRTFNILSDVEVVLPSLDRYAWGSASSGRLGNGTTSPPVLEPSHTDSPLKWYKISAGNAHSLGIDPNNDLYAWGFAGSGSLGNGTTTPNVSNPEHIGALKWGHVSAGSAHSLGILTNGDLYAWGLDTFGRLGLGSTSGSVLVPTQVGSGKWRAVAAGTSGVDGGADNGYSLAISENGDLYSWGHPEHGKLGNGLTTGNVLEPAHIGSLKWKVVATGTTHSLGITEDGDLYSWGNAALGRLGNGTTTPDVLTPQKIGDLKWKAISAGHVHSFGITDDGDLYAWGLATRAGDGSTTGNYLVPTRIGTLKWVDIQCSEEYSAGITEDGGLYTWGNASHGRLGNGTFSGTVYTATHVAGSLTFSTVVTGLQHAMALEEL